MLIAPILRPSFNVLKKEKVMRSGTCHDAQERELSTDFGAWHLFSYLSLPTKISLLDYYISTFMSLPRIFSFLIPYLILIFN